MDHALNKTYIVAVLVIILSFAVGALLYPRMPDTMASHWNAAGDADGYMSKAWALFLMPVISLLIFLLLVFIPRIDPLKMNVEKFKKQYAWFITLMLMFLAYVYLLSITWNIGYRFSMTLMVLPAIALLLFYAGILIEKSERNWFIGVKTPWTLSSDTVWRKTSDIAGKLFKIEALIVIISIFFPRASMFLVLIPLLLIAVFVFVYSYIIYRAEQKSKPIKSPARAQAPAPKKPRKAA